MSTPGENPVAVAADTGIIGGVRRAFVVYRTRVGGLSHGTLSSTGTWSPIGPIPLVPPLQALNSGAGFPSLARIGGTQSLLLTYRNSAGMLFEQVGDIVGTTRVWGTPLPLFSGFIGSPALTTLENTTLGANGVLMLTTRMSGANLTFELWRRTAAGSWSPATTLTQPNDSTWGRPVIEVRTFRTGAGSVDRLLISWRSTGDRLISYIRTSPPGTLSGTAGNNWTQSEGFSDIGETSAHAAELSFDTRFPVRGLRGSWSGVFPRCMPGPNACPVGSTCTSFASGSSANAALGCVSNTDGLVQAYERLSPGADGVQPIIFPDFNEWPMLRYGYCYALREEGGTRAWAPMDYRDSAASCAAKQTYAR